MQTTVDKKVLDRVRKLLALAADGGATEHEAALAAERARAIMAENGISNATVEASGGEGEGRTADSRSGHTGKRWMRDIMRALAEQAFVIVEYEQGRMAYNVDAGVRKKVPGKWQLWGRESAVITVKLMHEYLVRTVDRMARERGNPTDELFKEAMGTRIAERVVERHEQAMTAQAREAREKRAAQAHPSNAGGSNALVVVLEDYAQKEKDLNNDLRMGWAPGTTKVKRDEREAEYAKRTAEREARRAALLAEGHTEEVVDMVMSGISLDRAIALADEEPVGDTRSERDKERDRKRAAKEEEKWQDRFHRQQQKAHAKYTSASYREGRRAADTVGLDTQVQQKEQREIVMNKKPMDDTALREVARGNVERNASWSEDDSADTIHDEVYTLAFDALHDYGAPIDDCRRVARELAMEHAQP